MRHHIRPFLTRHEPRAARGAYLKSGVGAVLAMTAIGGLAAVTDVPLLIAPFGASAVLLFGQPASPLAQPMNVFGGYLVAASLALAATIWLPGVWWAATAAVGISIGLMLAFRLTHPPAGAIPIVAYSSAMAPETLLTVILTGCACLVAIATLHHRIPPRHEYPRRS